MKTQPDFDTYLEGLLERERELSAEWRRWRGEPAAGSDAALKPATIKQSRHRANHIVEEPFDLKERTFALRYELALLRLGGTPEMPWEPSRWIGFQSAGMKIRDWARRKVRGLLEW